MKTKTGKFHKFFEAMKEVLEDERTVILTDKELCVLVNQKLKKADRVAYQTFLKWLSPTHPRNVEGHVSVSGEDKEDFAQALGYARVIQKMNLSDKLTDPNSKNAWGASFILERKFEDLKKQPQIQLNSNPTIQISAGDKEAQKMIDAMINGEIIDIDYEEDNLRIEE